MADAIDGEGGEVGAADQVLDPGFRGDDGKEEGMTE
jgi:hypothetical protein